MYDLSRIGDEQSPEDAEDGAPELLFVHGYVKVEGKRALPADLFPPQYFKLIITHMLPKLHLSTAVLLDPVQWPHFKSV